MGLIKNKLKNAVFSLLLVGVQFCMSCGGAAGGSESTVGSSKDLQVVLENKLGQVLEVYPWEPVVSQKILPTTFPLPVSIGSNLAVQACRGEFEPASFIVRSNKNLTDIKIAATDLIGEVGRPIPASAVDIRLVKCWYQSGTGTVENQKTVVLTPELLLRDDTLVRVDTVLKRNYLKVTINDFQQHIDISKPTAVFPDKAVVKDALTLQPFSMTAKSNKQVWVTVRVPADALSGDYRGVVNVMVPGEGVMILPLTVTVLPFDLPAPSLEYSIYYHGKLYEGVKNGINSDWKTDSQYRAEMDNMKEHGAASPNLYQSFNEALLKQALAIRKQAGMKEDVLYVVGSWLGNPTSVEGLAKLSETIRKWLGLVKAYGYKDIFFYGVDEAVGEQLVAEKASWQEVHKAGAKVFVSCFQGAVDSVGDLLDLAILNGVIKTAEVDKWHAKGKKVFIYNNPQAGIEDPLLYRRNYGFQLWHAGYDGLMSYVYQRSFGHIWNDFDDKAYRDHVFAYPTSSGVVDTVQWEGFREAVDDMRYLAALEKKKGKSYTKQWLGQKLSNGDGPKSVRQEIIRMLL